MCLPPLNVIVPAPSSLITFRSSKLKCIGIKITKHNFTTQKLKISLSICSIPDKKIRMFSFITNLTLFGKPGYEMCTSSSVPDIDFRNISLSTSTLRTTLQLIKRWQDILQSEEKVQEAWLYTIPRSDISMALCWNRTILFFVLWLWICL